MVRMPGFGVAAWRALVLIPALLFALAASPGAVAGGGLASAGDAPIDRTLQQRIARNPGAVVAVLIQRSTDRAAIEAVRAAGGTVGRQLKIAHVLAARVPAVWLK